MKVQLAIGEFCRKLSIFAGCNIIRVNIKGQTYIFNGSEEDMVVSKLVGTRFRTCKLDYDLSTESALLELSKFVNCSPFNIRYRKKNISLYHTLKKVLIMDFDFLEDGKYTFATPDIETFLK